MSLLMTTLSRVRRSATGILCQTKLRAVAQKFTLYVDEFGGLGADGIRGPSSGNPLDLEDFQEQLYRVNGYWDLDPNVVIGCERNKQLLMCPDGPWELMRRSSIGLSAGAIFPISNVSIGFNLHLFQAPVQSAAGGWSMVDVYLSPKVLNYPLVPLVFDVDGEQAPKRGLPPFYAAPPQNSSPAFSGGVYWFPSNRHAGKTQAAFIGGHVAASSDPANEPGWDWRYEPSQTGVSYPLMDN